MTRPLVETTLSAENPAPPPERSLGKALALFRRDLKRGKPNRVARSGSGSPSGKSDPARSRRSQAKSREDEGAFVLYVEGPRDLEILGHWAKRLDPVLARYIDEKTVILGGKQPARAISDFRKRGGTQAGVAGLIVLDRDDHGHADHDEVRQAASQVGLEVFVWSLRHIESYLLVPDVIRRVLGLDLEDRRIEDLIRDQEAAGARTAASDQDETGSSGHSVHAKRILGAGGALAEIFGAETRAGEIARAMRHDDLHEDVHALFERVRRLSGLMLRGPEVEVIVRPARQASPMKAPPSAVSPPPSLPSASSSIEADDAAREAGTDPSSEGVPEGHS